MYSIYRWLYRQFAFSRGQSNGLLILLPLCVILVFSEPVCRYFVSREPLDFSKESAYLDSMMARIKEPSPVQEPEYFEFDPNNSSADKLQKLGFTPATTRRIIAYTEKGGRFRTPEDLYKIYGSDSATVRAVLPWVRIRDSRQGSRRTAGRQEQLQKRPAQRPEPFDLNLADTAELKLVRGIGSKLSVRIIRYREALGGFYRPEQLYEVFKLDSAVVHDLQKISFISPGFSPRQIPINSAQPADLASHPYLTAREAAAIVAYRFTHGKFAAVEDLGKIEGLDSLRLSRVLPYLTVD